MAEIKTLLPPKINALLLDSGVGPYVTASMGPTPLEFYDFHDRDLHNERGLPFL